MAENLPRRNLVAIGRVPENFGLKDAKTFLQETLKDNNPTEKVVYARNPDGSAKKNTIIVQLTSAEHVDALLSEVEIDVEHKDELHTLLFTKARPSQLSGSISQSNDEKSTGSKESFVEKVPVVNEDEDVRNRQRSLYCSRIPPHMYSKPVLKQHFMKYGHIVRLFLSDRKARFAIIEYDNHDSAERALNEAWNLRPLPTDLNIQWDTREAEQLRGQNNKPTMRRSRSRGNLHSGREFQVTKSSPVSWRTLIKQDRDLFTQPLNRCVLVQNVPKHVDNSRLRQHFEDKARSSGGQVKRMIPLEDGILVKFQNNQTAKNVVDHDDHMIDNHLITTYLKPIPPPSDDRFIIEGKFDDLTTLEGLLDCCDESQSSYNILNMNDEDSFLVTYSNPVDIVKIMKAIEKVPLQNVKPKTCEVCHADCILVEDIKTDVTNDVIKLTFMNKKLSNGGDVTYVKRSLQGSNALVYFANYKDAENVVKHSNDQKINIIGGAQVTVSLCYDPTPSLGNSRPNKERRQVRSRGRRGGGRQPRPRSQHFDLKEKKFGVHQFDYAPETDCDIIHFVSKSEAFIKQLATELQELAKVEFRNVRSSNPGTTGRNVVAKFKPVSREKLQKDFQNDQGKFESECIQKVIQFFSVFSSDGAQFNSKKLQSIRRAYAWNEKDDVIKVEIDEDDVHFVFVRWNNDENGSSKIVGLSNDVKAVIKWLQMQCNYTIESQQYSKEDFEILEKCNVFEEVSQEFSEKVKMEVNGNTFKVTFKGLSDDVAQARKEMKRHLQGIGRSKLTSLDDCQLKFLQEAIPKNNGNNNLASTISSHLSKDKIGAILYTQPELGFVFKQINDKAQAEALLNRLIQTREIQVESGFENFIHTPQWRKFQQNLSSGDVRTYTNPQNSSLTIVGLTTSINSAYQQVRKFVSDNVVERKVVDVCYPFALFLKEFAKELNSDVGLKGLSWKLTSDRGGGISLSGKCLLVTKGETWLQQSEKSMKKTTKSIKEPGMATYFRNKTGKDFLRTTQTVTKCIILVDTDKCSDWGFPEARVPSTSSNAQIFTAKTLVTATIPGKRVSISVVQNDITAQQCDAIVNTSNSDLDLRAAGVSGSILKKGGKSIQQEMKIEKMQIGGILQVGDAVSTSAGSLPFKRIIHVNGPTWSKTNHVWASQCVKECVEACFSQADHHNLSSIAMPAISCGIFGGDETVCVPLIVQAILEYFNNNTSNIKQCFLVEINNASVLKVMKDEVKKIEKPSSSGFVSSLKSYFSRGSSSQATPSSRITPASPKVSVKQGDISNETADAVVTSTSPQHFASACGSATSKALFKKAGNALQGACRQAASTQAVGFGNVIETPGFNLPCKKIFHVILSQYGGSGQGAHFLNGIRDCLRMAESNGFARIAFPALGTGGMNYPANLVAFWFQQEINNFKAINLKNVDIVLYPTDQTTIAEFNKVFSASTSTSAIPSPISLSQQTSTSTLSISVRQGDILSTNCDVIVNPTSSNFDLSGQLSKQLVARGGQSIITECQSSPSYSSSSSNYKVTSGGKLNCQYIIHVASPSDAQKIASVLQEIFTSVDQTLNLKSIAIPAIGTGNVGLNSSDVAFYMNIAIQNFQQSNPRHLRKIDVIIYDANMLSDFSTQIASTSSSASRTVVRPPVKPRMSKTSLIPVENPNDSADEIQLYMCSNKKANIDEAWKRISQHIKDKSLRKTLKNEVLPKLSNNELKELKSLERKHAVVLRWSNGSRQGELVISGLKDDVMDAYTTATEILQEYKEALTCAEYVVWKYKDSQSGKFVDFPLRASFQIETAYKKNPKSSLTVEVRIQRMTQKFFVDLNTKTETNLTNNVVSSIVRESKTSSSSDDLPSIWEDMGKDFWKKFIVQSNSSEYQQILSTFQATGGSFNVVQLERIQNPTLYKQFHAQKRKVEARMKSTGSFLPVTRNLFHGTSPDVCDNIYKDGFDRSHAGRNATAYGKGVYFATTSQYSKSYATPDNQGFRRMFYADVITGEFCQGNSSYVTPPLMPGFTTQRYDSVVNNVNNPSMFVVFKDASVYPSYMLTYR